MDKPDLNNEVQQTDTVILNYIKLDKKRVMPGPDVCMTWVGLTEVLEAIGGKQRTLTRNETYEWSEKHGLIYDHKRKLSVVPAGTAVVGNITVKYSDLVFHMGHCLAGNVSIVSGDNIIRIAQENELTPMSVNGMNANTDFGVANIAPKIQEIIWNLAVSEAEKQKQNEEERSRLLEGMNEKERSRLLENMNEKERAKLEAILKQF